MTHMFLHADFWHILLNMWALYILGPDCERELGRTRFLIFYFSTGIGAAIFHSIATPYKRIPCIGASGAIFGLLAAYAVFFPKRKLGIWIGVGFIFVPAYIFAILYAFVETLYVLSGVTDLVAHTAHIGGFLVGVTFAFVHKKARRKGLRIHPYEITYYEFEREYEYW